MLLPQQVQAIIYHLIAGWFYGLALSFTIYFNDYIKNIIIKIVVQLIFHCSFVLVFYAGLFKINFGISNLYLVMIAMIGFIIYVYCYNLVFLSMFATIKSIFKPVMDALTRFTLVKLKISSIIKVRINKFRRRKRNGKSDEEA